MKFIHPMHENNLLNSNVMYKHNMSPADNFVLAYPTSFDRSPQGMFSLARNIFEFPNVFLKLSVQVKFITAQ